MKKDSTLKGCEGVVIVSHPFRVPITNSFFPVGLRFAATTGYYLAALQAAVLP